MRLVLVLSLFLVAAGVVVHFDREYRVSVLKRVGGDVSSVIYLYTGIAPLKYGWKRWEQQALQLVSSDKRDVLASCNHPDIVKYSQAVDQFCSDPVLRNPNDTILISGRTPYHVFYMESELFPGKRKLSQLLIVSGFMLYLYCLVLVCYSYIRAIWRKRHELCGVCGYPSRGVQSAVCPECGTAWGAGLREVSQFYMLKYLLVYILAVSVQFYCARACYYSKQVQASIGYHENNLNSSAGCFMSTMIYSAIEDDYFIQSSQGKSILTDMLSEHAGHSDYSSLTKYCIDHRLANTEASLYKAFRQDKDYPPYSLFFSTPGLHHRSDQKAAIIALFGYCNTPDSLGCLIDILDSPDGDKYRTEIITSLVQLDLCEMEDVVREKLGSMHDAGKRQDVELLLDRCSEPGYQYKPLPTLEEEWSNYSFVDIDEIE